VRRERTVPVKREGRLGRRLLGRVERGKEEAWEEE